MRVGWIGLGAMGAPMARVAARDHDVTAYDIAPGAAAALADAGVVEAASPAEAARGVDVLAVMVATPDQVESALFGEHGAAAHLPEDATVMVMSTVGPEPMTRWAARLPRLVDAPVSGGVARAATGDLLIMYAASDADDLRTESLRAALGARSARVGAVPGEGQKVKLVNQLLCGSHIAVAAEALAFATSMGLDARACWEVIRGGAAASFMLDDRGERMVDEAFEPTRSAVDIFVKDMGLVTAAAAEVGAWTPIAAAVEDLFREGHRRGLGRQDDSAIITVLREHLAP